MHTSRYQKRTFYGFTNRRQAERFGDRFDALVASRRSGLKDLASPEWLAALAREDPPRYDKLASWGLAEERIRTATLGELTALFTSDSSVKPRTRSYRRTVCGHLLAFFGEARELSTLTEADADAFTAHRQAVSAPTSWGREVKAVKQLFRLAIHNRWLDRTPFEHLKGSSKVNASRQYFVSLDDSQRILEACPNAEMRLIFSLPRFGGLRIPSELQFMEWNDIDLTGDRFTVKIPKKTGKLEQERGEFTTRAVPMFPELRKAFTEYFEALPDGAPARLFPVVNGQALKNRFLKILHRAGVPVWPKFFQNMRSTRETELLDRYPIQDVTAWIGNTPEVARRHYLQIRPEIFVQASSASTFRVCDAPTLTLAEFQAQVAQVLENADPEAVAELWRRVHDSPKISSMQRLATACD